jgi:hypothetical protein
VRYWRLPVEAPKTWIVSPAPAERRGLEQATFGKRSSVSVFVELSFLQG